MKKLLLISVLVSASFSALADRDRLIKRVELSQGQEVEVIYGEYQNIRPCGYFNSMTDICVLEDESESKKKKYQFNKLAGVSCEKGEYEPQQLPIQGGGAIRFDVGMSSKEYEFYSQAVIEYRFAQYEMQYHQTALKSGESHLISNQVTGNLTSITCK